MNVSIYSAELLIEQLPTFTIDAFLPALRRHCGKVEPLGGEDSGEALLFSFPEHESEFADGQKMAAQIALLHGTAPVDHDQLLPVIQQSWLWEDCAATVEKHKSVLFVTDLFANLLDRKERLALFKKAVSAVSEVVPALALKWTPSQQIIPPQMYLEQADAPDDALFPAINVRMFKAVKDNVTEFVMDTIGLEIFDLPDFQCRFTGVEPQLVATALYDAAYYVFEHGDVIKDGETIQGVGPGDLWLCHDTTSLAAPARRVFDLGAASIPV